MHFGQKRKTFKKLLAVGQQIFNWTCYEEQSARNRILIGHLVHPKKCWDPLHTIFAKFSLSLCLTEAAPSMGNQLVLSNVKFKSMALWPLFSGSYSTPSNQSYSNIPTVFLFPKLNVPKSFKYCSNILNLKLLHHLCFASIWFLFLITKNILYWAIADPNLFLNNGSPKWLQSSHGLRKGDEVLSPLL